MLRSMTGFGAGDAEDESCRAHVEVKSVNQRYLDLNFYLPSSLHPFEDAMRQKVNEAALRGKIDINVSFQDKREKKLHIKVDKSLAVAYHDALNELSDIVHLARPDDINEIVACDGVLTLEQEDSEMEACRPVLFMALDKALQQFLAMRGAEGKNIQEDFEKRITVLEKYTDEIAALAPGIVQHYRDHLQKVLDDILHEDEIDETRIIQETALYADKINYTEEIVRLRSHFQQFRQIIREMQEPAGRKLDFLIQEMNREINTAASKANSAQVAQLAVDVKSEIEKLREQVQNIE